MSTVLNNHYAYIDALRGVAIMGVVLIHTSQWIVPSSELLTLIAAQGSRGVQLFYVASALTLFLSMSKRNVVEDRSVLKYFIRRFFRIAPAFYIAIIAYGLYGGLSNSYWAPGGIEWWYFPLTALFLHGWSPETINSIVPGGWSIAVEFSFYMIAPVMFRLLSSLKISIVAFIICLFAGKIISYYVFQAVSLLYPESQHYLIKAFSFFIFTTQLPVFILGIMLYHLLKLHPTACKEVSLSLLILSLFLFLGFLDSNVIPKHISYSLSFVIFSLSLAYYPYKIFVNPLIMFIGKLSFSIYLSHFMVIYALQSFFSEDVVPAGDGDLLPWYLVVLLLSSVVSFFTYTFIEVPGMKLGSKIISKL